MRLRAASKLTCGTDHRSTELFLCKCNLRKIGKVDRILHRGDFGEDGDCDLRGRATADIQPDRPVQPRDLLRSQVEFLETLAPLGVVGPRSQSADIERR